MYTHQQLRMTCTKLILWRSASRNTCDACIRIGGGSLPTNSCRSACVSLCGCAIACTRHASRSSRCLQVTKSLSETATLCHLVPFLKVEVKQLKVQKWRGVRFYYTCILSPLETSHPPLFHHALICQWLRKACHEYKNSGMHVAARQIDRYKDAPSRTLPRQTSDVPIETDALSLLSASALVSYASGKQKRRKSRRTITSALISAPRGRILLEVWNTQSLSVYIPLHLNHPTIAASFRFRVSETKEVYFFGKKNVRNDCPKRICTSTE